MRLPRPLATGPGAERSFSPRGARWGQPYGSPCVRFMAHKVQKQPAPSDPHGPTDVARRPVWRRNRTAVIPADGASCLLVSYSR